MATSVDMYENGRDFEQLYLNHLHHLEKDCNKKIKFTEDVQLSLSKTQDVEIDDQNWVLQHANLTNLFLEEALRNERKCKLSQILKWKKNSKLPILIFREPICLRDLPINHQRSKIIIYTKIFLKINFFKQPASKKLGGHKNNHPL